MSDQLEALVDSLLYEGYALYPYTPTATKNATPTPFGIAYPPAYARALTTTYDHLELRCVLAAPPDAVLSAEVRFLAPVGERHRAESRTLAISGKMAGALAEPARAEHVVSAAPEIPPLEVALALSATPIGGGEYEVVFRVENRTVVSSGLDRAAALARSLLSTHPMVRITGGRFLSPLERPCRSVNTFPVLATAADDVMLGAAIVLPDHPQIAPESRGSLFDATEIEEALLLHVQVLSDGEREEIARQDPAVRAMIERAQSATPEDLLSLHGRVTLRDPSPAPTSRDPLTLSPPAEPPGLPDPRGGEEAAQVGGRTFRRGGRVVINPPADADIQARMLAGRRATIERIFTDYDGRTHLGVTIDDDPGQELMRETGRYLFFFAPEVEVVDP